MTATNLTVRLVEARDHASWSELFLAYGEFYETSFDDTVLSGVWSWLMLEDHPIRGFVAELEGQIVGFGHLRRHPDTFEAADSWFLDDLYTRPEARGAGIASAIIDAMAKYAQQRGGGTIRWITAQDNDRAQRLYDRIATKTSWVTYEKEIPRS